MARGTARPAYAQIVGARVRAHRAALGWTQAELASAAAKHVTYVSRIESGSVRLTVEALIDVAFALGVDPAELARGLVPGGRRRRLRDIGSPGPLPDRAPG